MLGTVFKKFAGSHHRRFQKKCAPVVAKINALETEYQQLSDEALQAKTEEFRERFRTKFASIKATIGDDEDKLIEARKRLLDELLPEAFAVVKNAARRLCGRRISFTGTETTWNMIHYDVQLIGGMALHGGFISEMATGEGKTLVATLPLYLNALTGRNCQLVTVNEYLAQRDAEWMGHLYTFLGLRVGVIKNQQKPDEKRDAYHCDITYATASELGFDYLRDNGMSGSAKEQVQSDHYFCIVDEVDSILVDEARTPLIISGPVPEDNTAIFLDFKPSVSRLVQLQTRQCHKLATEARKSLENADGDHDQALENLLVVRLGMPKNPLLLEILENGQWRNAFEKYESEMNSDVMKKEMYKIKEKLYYSIDERHHTADLTEIGRETLAPKDPDAFTLPDLPTQFTLIDNKDALSAEEKVAQKQELEAEFAKRSESIHSISQLLRAYSLYERDKEYIVHEGKVIIIDQNTGRAMPGRRWSDGLHQAVEAKEGTKIERESKTYATITIQNYFRLYEKLAGMTGTAETEAGEFHDIYKLDVRVIPTNKPCIRIDDHDVIYKTKREKFNNVVAEIQEAHDRGQPVLCGTASVITSEELSRLLDKAGIRHNVLNAKQHASEAEIVAQAGQRGAVTIATNMAGRGTDIKLGEGVAELGGLLVLGTERHESRRIDRQLRGRCSRQGDPGRSKFYVSLEDDLMRLFANQGPLGKILQSTFQEGEELAHPLLNRSIETAQKKVEQRDFSIRKRLLQYDDVLNRQREVVYGIRNDALHDEEPRKVIYEMIREELEDRVDAITPTEDAEADTDELDSLLQWVNGTFPVAMKRDSIEGQTGDQMVETLFGRINEVYLEKASLEDPEHLTQLERHIIVRGIDRNWQDHLTEMEDLRRSVGLRSYGQKDPLVEYKSEAFKYFNEMMGRIRGDICRGAFRSATSADVFHKLMEKIHNAAITIGPSDDATGEAEAKRADGTVVAQKPQASSAKKAATKRAPANAQLPKVETVKRELPKIGRNAVVTVRDPKTGKTEQMKFKKAEPLLRDKKWELVNNK